MIPGAGASPRPRSPAPLPQLSHTSGLRTLVRTAQAAETCHAHPNAYLWCIMITAPCFPAPSVTPAGCSPQISVTAKSARPAGSAPRHRPLANPGRGSWLHKISLGFYQASPQRKRPLLLPASDFPPAAWERKVGLRPCHRDPAAPPPGRVRCTRGPHGLVPAGLAGEAVQRSSAPRPRPRNGTFPLT